jgi:hypothetical protein
MATLEQLKLLMNLAQIDGSVAEREKNYIVNIGRANGIYPDQVIPLFDQKHDLIVPQNLLPDQKFEILFSLVQLMKIDERMYKEEIIFCSEVASRLGYQQQVMFEMMLHVKSGAMPQSEIDTLKALVQQYLK